MPTVTTRLAWALSVDVAGLVIHIDAEATYRSVIDTLTLCYVFGRGEYDDITRLPTELVDMIEEYLAADKVAFTERRRLQADDFRECAEGSCSPYDHFSEHQRLELVNSYLEVHKARHVESLQDEGVQDAEDRALVLGLDRHMDGWQGKHASNIAGWQELVGKLGKNDDGLFTKHREFIHKQYGLEVFVARTQTSKRFIDAFAYLTLPDGIGRNCSTHTTEVLSKTHSRYSPRPLGPGNFPVEDELTHMITIPSKSTQAEEGRFPRTLTLLGLPGRGVASCEEEKLKGQWWASPELMMLGRIVGLQ